MKDFENTFIFIQVKSAGIARKIQLVVNYFFNPIVYFSSQIHGKHWQNTRVRVHLSPLVQR